MLHPLLLPVLLAGCIDEPPRYVYGTDLDDLELVLWSRSEGVYPDTSVLDDPNNPFASGVGGDIKWDLVSDQAWIPAFYAWGTVLAYEPSGEAQFYAATSMAEIYRRQLAADDDLYFTWVIAVDGFQAVLDSFPDSVTYDATGTISYRLAPLAWQAIVDLGGEPQGDWIVVQTEDGGTTIVPGS